VKKCETKQYTVVGMEVVVFRGENGKVSVIDAWCPHLGVSFGVGKVVNNNIECPFHGWQFDQEGSCVKVPQCDKPPNVKAKMWISEEVNRQVIVWYSVDDEKPTWEPTKIEELSSNNYVSHGYISRHIQAHIRDIHENAVDRAHFNFLHDGILFDMLTPEWSLKYEFSDTEKNYSVYYLEPVPTIFGIPIRIITTTTRLTQMGPALGITEYVFPFGKIFMVFCATPVAPWLTKVEHEIFSDWKIPRIISKYFLSEALDQIEKDSRMWENKITLGKPYLSKADGDIMKYRRWYQQFYSEKSLTLEQLKNQSMEW